MATSESDDFESADEELNARQARTERANRTKKYNSIGSDSDDDQDFIPVQYHTPMKRTSREEARNLEQKTSNSIDKTDKKSKVMDKKESETSKDIETKNSDNKNVTESSEKPKETINKRERPQRQRKPKEVQSLGAKKLGAIKIDKLPEPEPKSLQDELKHLEQLKISDKPPEPESLTPDQQIAKAIAEGRPPPNIQTCWELPDELNRLEELKKKKNSKDIDEEDIPEELKSNLKFKDLFKPDGWEGIGDDVDLPDDLSDDKYQPVLDKLSEQKNTNDSWGSWGSWGVSSLLNTATIGVSTLTSHVSQGLSMLEESMGVPDPVDLAQTENVTAEKTTLDDKKIDEPKEDKPDEQQAKEEPKEESSQFSSFGFGNFLSSMSSITKLVESTSSKVITGGLDTLEVIGKKTMEVLQEGDPGLKKKRAFFTNDANKPILSHILREAKEKADIEEKSVEAKELARKVHFESLFDDYQGLVHLEALEMLSKQCNMKIQQQLVNVDGNDLTSMQETLDEVKELCDLGDEDDDDDEETKDKDLKQKLDEACKDLGVTITYDKILDVWNKMKTEVSESNDPSSHREIYQKAISALAQFTAYSVERFHKTAELLLIKPRRSTVNEADSLVQLTKTLSSQISSVANLYCDKLNELKEESIEPEVNTNTVAIYLEATNASSYVQEAFRLLIPILQVGAI